MALTATQVENIKRIERRRKKESGFMATLEFFSTAANMFCLYSDALSIFGIAMILTSPIGLSVALGVTIGAAALAIIAGGIWAYKQSKGYRKSRKQEIELMQDCYELENKGITLSTPSPEPEKRNFWQATKRLVSKAGNRIMSGANGASTILGVAGVIFGIFSIGFAPAMPIYLIVLIASAVVLAVGFGIAYAVSEYGLSRSQNKNIEMLTDKKQALENSSTKQTISTLKTKKKQQKSDYKKEIADAKQEIANAKQEVADAKQKIADAQIEIENLRAEKSKLLKPDGSVADVGLFSEKSNAEPTTQDVSNNNIKLIS